MQTQASISALKKLQKMGIELEPAKKTTHQKRSISIGDLLDFLDVENEKFEELNLTEEDVNALIGLMTKRYPSYVDANYTVDVSTHIIQRNRQRNVDQNSLQEMKEKLSNDFQQTLKKSQMQDAS